MLTRETILHHCGDLPDWKVVRIEASGAKLEDLMIALAWTQGQQLDHKPLVGQAAYLYEVLTADEDIWGEEDR
jgi:hypothetical protein